MGTGPWARMSRVTNKRFRCTCVIVDAYYNTFMSNGTYFKSNRTYFRNNGTCLKSNGTYFRSNETYFNGKGTYV